jgi:cobalt/nickel transport system permease protein
MLDLLQPILAVHISDGYLNRPLEGLPWLAGGYVVMALLAFWGSWRIRDEEIPRIALLTAAFTVASALHVPIGAASVHLILNGLVGAILGRRAALAIPVGLFLQAVAGHGGFTTLGINSCIMLTPALLAGFALRSPTILHACKMPALRSLEVGIAGFAWTMSVIFGVALLLRSPSNFDTISAALGWATSLLGPALAAAAVAAIIAICAERLLRLPPEFPLGYLVGQVAVMLSVSLSALVMLLGGPANEGAYLFALIFFIAHLPLAVVEGLVLGFLVPYLLRVKPEMLQASSFMPRAAAEPVPLQAAIPCEPRGVEECPADTLS